MNAVLDSSEVRYAVIEGLHTEAGPERFVIAYSNEGSLRGLIAAPSIIALGFSSREEAAISSVCFPAVGACQRVENTGKNQAVVRNGSKEPWSNAAAEMKRGKRGAKWMIARPPVSVGTVTAPSARLSTPWGPVAPPYLS